VISHKVKGRLLPQGKANTHIIGEGREEKNGVKTVFFKKKDRIFCEIVL
jgi:hypothetical protein